MVCKYDHKYPDKFLTGHSYISPGEFFMQHLKPTDILKPTYIFVLIIRDG